MSGRFLLDTSVVIAILESNQDVLRYVAREGEYFISTTVLGELLYGAEHSARKIENLQRVNLFCDSVGCMSCDQLTAAAYGKIKASLRSKGKPIPENDIWISAVANQHKLTLVTRDAHFDYVEEIERLKV